MSEVFRWTIRAQYLIWPCETGKIFPEKGKVFVLLEWVLEKNAHQFHEQIGFQILFWNRHARLC